MHEKLWELNRNTHVCVRFAFDSLIFESVPTQSHASHEPFLSMFVVVVVVLLFGRIFVPTQIGKRIIF